MSGEFDEEKLEAAVQRGVRAELRRLARNAGQVVVGALFALFVLPVVAAAVALPLYEAGVPGSVLALGGLCTFLLLVAYGWRLPPFR